MGSCRFRRASHGRVISVAGVASRGPYIEIMPARPECVVAPSYDPLVVYARPRPGFALVGAISFGYGVASASGMTNGSAVSAGKNTLQGADFSKSHLHDAIASG